MNPLMRCIVLASMLLSGVTVAFVMIAPGIAFVDDGESGSLREQHWALGTAGVIQSRRNDPPVAASPRLLCVMSGIAHCRRAPCNNRVPYGWRPLRFLLQSVESSRAPFRAFTPHSCASRSRGQAA
jgi:hypothetical protein